MKDKLLIPLKGFAMGVADIVPGVSGGTVALITGIYDDLISSISSVNKSFFSKIIRFEIRSAFNHINGAFLLPLFIGILTAIISMSKLMHFLMKEYSYQTWSLFFGLILASIVYIAKNTSGIKSLKSVLLIILGTGVGYGVTSLIPVQTPQTLLMVFFSGCIAICAMILPGISGSFILLILGKYLYITSAIKDPFGGDNIFILMTFAFGCLIGLLSFSKLLNYLLKNFHTPLMCVLIGFMIGSLKKIWPWKEVIESKIIRGKTHVLSEAMYFPKEIDGTVVSSFVIMFLGLILVFGIEKISESK